MGMLKATSLFTITYIITMITQHDNRHFSVHGIIALSVILYVLWLLWQVNR